MSRKPNPDMLSLARESRGMTQAELAKAIGVSQANISKFEKRTLEISAEHLARISRALNYPEEFFLQNEAIYGYGSTCIYHRKRQTLPAYEYRQLLAKVNVVRLQVARLLHGTEIDAPNKFPRLDSHEYGSPELVARLVRGMWHLPPGPMASLVGAIESAGGIVVRCSFGTRKLDAFSQWPPGLPPLFFVNAEASVDRCRFTLAHELGHVVMHMVPTPKQEQEADAFAAEFLMPRKEIGHHLRPMSLPRLVELKAYWRVSMTALIRRARDLKKITESQYRSLYTQMSKLGYRMNEPRPLEPEEPTVLRSIIDVHRRDHGYSIAALSAVALANEAEFVSQYLPEHSRFRVIG